MRITKLTAAFGIIAIVALSATAAYATHVFTDVEDDRFYADAAEWAKDNGITTGCGDGTTFCPEDPVTRGENITFAKRYDDNIVQPALADLDATIEELEMQLEELQAAALSRPVVLYARIGGSGTAAANSGLLASTRASVGVFNLQWDRDVSNCVATATDLGWALVREVSIEAGRDASTFALTSDVSGVTVRDASGALVDTTFNVVLACPSDTLSLTSTDSSVESPNQPDE